MSLPSFEEFSAAARARGFDEVLVREWQAGHATPEHEHPFDVTALVVRGEFWLSVGGEVRHLKPGDTFEVKRGTRHAERYGADGATFWTGRAN